MLSRWAVESSSAVHQGFPYCISTWMKRIFVQELAGLIGRALNMKVEGIKPCFGRTMC